MTRFATIVCVLAFTAPAFAQDASGAWELRVKTTQRDGKTSMVLKKDGEKLSGTIIGPQEAELAITGTQAGPDITLSFTVNTQNGPVAVAMKGRQDGDGIKGTLEVGAGADRGDWTASRAAPPAAASSGPSAVDISGTWAYEVNTDAGVRMATVTLNQQGETLTGRYKSQLGEAPLTGKIKDASFTFQVTLPIEGTPMTLTYKGTVDGNAVKGDVNVADLGSATFTGKKQGAGAH